MWLPANKVYVIDMTHCRAVNKSKKKKTGCKSWSGCDCVIDMARAVNKS